MLLEEGLALLECHAAYRFGGDYPLSLDQFYDEASGFTCVFGRWDPDGFSFAVNRVTPLASRPSDTAQEGSELSRAQCHQSQAVRAQDQL